ncbi:hypothetical protein [Sinorhizobium meliloti]|uniref:hypothetical protein n=1 Tax=Rhizobium meliloti TaxID=382 RepID=UPI000FD6C5D0|nr:hypothetical protein [Sinorhizobium meliloti]RVQ02026.1 hypothetical protein CN069_14915 [Sinorhizobium meliloti]
MKLKSIDHLAYNPEPPSLSIRGKNSIGKTSVVEIPVETPAKLLSAISAAMLGHPEVQSGLYVDKLDVVTTRMGTDKFVIRLVLYSMNMRLDFLIRREFRTQSEADAQSSHLRTAFETLLSPGKASAN